MKPWIDFKAIKAAEARALLEQVATELPEGLRGPFMTTEPVRRAASQQGARIRVTRHQPRGCES